MQQSLDLLQDTLEHFDEGAKSVWAYTNEQTFIISRQGEEFWVATEEPGFPKKKAESLDDYFKEVFGIEARY